MEYRRFGTKYVVRLDRGEEIVSSLTAFCQQHNIQLGAITGIGAVDKATIGLFEPATKEYHAQELTGDMEITCLVGNVTTKEGEVYLHLHATLAGNGLQAQGGHLNSAVISATGEIIIDVIDGRVGRKFDKQVGLNLFDF
ncbi:MAG: DNA-binding protein [Firmicutes bacterium]|nr:DNA-binding protein [Bacillota bacterium]